jgi:glycosyltransferase involved in cell wall biosynthesis
MNKKIWIISHYAMTPAQGTLTRHYIFAEHLRKKGYNCRIFASSAIHNTEDTNMIEGNERYIEVKQDNIDYTYIRTRNYNNKFMRVLNMVDFFFGVLSTCKKYKKPDVIYVSMPHFLAGLAGVIVARRLKVRCVLEVRDLWPETIVQYRLARKHNPLIPPLYALEKWLYVHADSLVFTMEGAMDYIRSRGWDNRIGPGKVSYINNGCDLESIRRNEKEFVFESGELDNPATFKVVYAGSIRYVNNVRQIVDCAQLLQDGGHSDIVFLIFGEGNQKEELIEHCRAENIGNVFFKGYVNKRFMPSILQRSDINLIHSTSNPIFKYGYSLNKVFDYLASGKPILSDIYCNPKFDILLRYDCGKTVEGNSAETLAQGVLAFHDMPKEERAAYGRRAELAAQDYDYTKLTELLEKALFPD